MNITRNPPCDHHQGRALGPQLPGLRTGPRPRNPLTEYPSIEGQLMTLPPLPTSYGNFPMPNRQTKSCDDCYEVGEKTHLASTIGKKSYQPVWCSG